MFRFFNKSPASAPIAPGMKLGGRYRVLRTFEGGLGLVCLVEDEQHSPDRGEAQFVLKFPKLMDAAQEAGFRREASVWVSLGRHPAIVPAFWVDIVGSRLCVAAEFIPPDHRGRTSLRDHLDGEPKPLRQICRWAAQFLAGLEHASARGMASHGDIKPDNLLIDPAGDLHITDFGLAKFLHKEQAAEGGTPAYMAPEQWRGEVLDTRSDLYAFGLVLFELCFGQRAYQASSLAGFRQAHLSAGLVIPPHPLANLISSLVQADRRSRPMLQDAITRLLCVARENGLSLPAHVPAIDRDRREELRAQSSIEGPRGAKSALDAALELTRLWPDDASGWTQVGRLYLTFGDLRQAHAATARSIRIDDTRSAPWNNLGLIWTALSEPEKAVLAFRRALECNPDNTGAMLNMARPLSDLGRREEAIRVLQGAVAIAPDKYAAWVNLAAHLWDADQKTAAVDALARGCSLAPPSAQPSLSRQLSEWRGALR